MKRKLYLDTETVGLNGPVKLIQYSVDRGPIKFIKLFQKDRVSIEGSGEWLDSGLHEQLDVLHSMLNDPETTFIGWNIPFDLFHLYRLFYGKSKVKPFRCQTVDLWLHAMRKGPFAPFMFADRGGGRAVATVRRIPKVARDVVARKVVEELAPLVPTTVTVHEHEVKGEPQLTTLSFGLEIKRLGLKPHAEYWGYPVIKLQDVWPLPQFEEKLHVYESGPAYDECERKCDEVLAQGEDSPFYNYARNDIEYLWLAEDKLVVGEPTIDDTGAHVVAYTRYFGYDVNEEVLHKTAAFYESVVAECEQLLAGTDLKSSAQRTALLKKYNPLICSSKKAVLEALMKHSNPELAKVATAILSYGSSKQKLDQVRKVIESGRLHAELRQIGTATGRKAGSTGFNVQGIGKVQEDANGEVVGLRAAVLTAAVGDFHQFELAIAAAAWGDTQLQNDLTAGVDIHLATACDCHPRLRGKTSYAVAKAIRKTPDHPEYDLIDKCRTECKRMVFGILYGCTAQKIADTFGVDMEEANRILQLFYNRYPGILRYKQNVERRFCTADTVTWSAGSVARMDDSETDLTGYTRHWTFEKQVACIMWKLGQKGLTTGLQGTIVRQKTKGPQAIDQAIRSAFLGAAIAIQQAVYRQAANMKIQTTGAQLCKMLEAMLFRAYGLPMLNVHDELVFARCPWFDYHTVEGFCLGFTKGYKSLVPHLRFDLSPAEKWSDK